MKRERIKRESLCGQGKRLPKSYRKWRRRQLSKLEVDSPEYRAWLARHREMLEHLNKDKGES